MGVLCMVIGESGSGKSTSLRNFNEGEVGIFNIVGKPLPFRKRLAKADHPTYKQVCDSLQKNNLRAYVIDDSTYLMQFSMFDHAKETGYGKFTDMAMDFEHMLRVAAATNNDTIVYLLHHPQFAEDGSMKPQTVGRMLDNQLNVSGLFPIVIECGMRDGKYCFTTNGEGIAKSPMEMMPDVMPNDLKAVDSLIREYWGMKPLTDQPNDK